MLQASVRRGDPQLSVTVRVPPPQVTEHVPGYPVMAPPFPARTGTHPGSGVQTGGGAGEVVQAF
ncbi:MAG: hypothetical protein WAW00_02980 [Candidatus Moraniibacteriota bacterium]